MASTTIFQTLRERVEKSNGLLPHERRAMFWFQNYSNELVQWQQQNKNTTYSGLAESRFAKKIVPPKTVMPGCLYFFMYQPHYARSLDYYDRMPFTLVLEKDNEGFLALNFHYLPYRVRAVFFDALHSSRLQKKNDPLKSRIVISYKLLTAVSKYKAFRPCLKRYRYKNCRTAMLQVGETEWDIALFLPVERFSKATRAEIWEESVSSLSDIGDEGAEETE
jgi:hypothetical protein